MAWRNNLELPDAMVAQLTDEEIFILLREIGDEMLTLREFRCMHLAMTKQYAAFSTVADFKNYVKKVEEESKKLKHRSKAVLDLTGDSDPESDMDVAQPDPEVARGDEAIEKLRAKFAKYKKK